MTQREVERSAWRCSRARCARARRMIPPSGGSFQLEARYALRTDDGALISVRNRGGPGGTAPHFETAIHGAYAFLVEEPFFGTISLAIGGVVISVYRAAP